MHGFISYAHDDYQACKLLQTHLRAIERSLRIEFWADTRIKAGNFWNSRIADAINRATTHILLFSPAFIRSDYIFDNELPAIDAKCANGDLVLPVVLDRCSWSTFVGVLQATPVYEGRVLPINDWSRRKHGFDKAREQIAESIKSHFGLRAKSPFKWGAK